MSGLDHARATDRFAILQGDALERLRELADDSVDSLITDPPAAIAYMGREWDGDKGGRGPWIAWLAEIMRECLRVLKPGASAAIWALPRTSHWTMTAVEDAGFEIRTVASHVNGQGFPKNHWAWPDIDRIEGVVPTEIGQYDDDATFGINKSRVEQGYRDNLVKPRGTKIAPTSDLAKRWEGWGTAVKPAAEFWILARKPLSEDSVARNLLKWGVGGINVEAGRSEDGRWPCNFAVTHATGCGDDGPCAPGCPVAELDDQSGRSRSRRGGARKSKVPGDGYGMTHTGSEYEDEGGASRFVMTFRADDGDLDDAALFRYASKPGKAERDAGVGGDEQASIRWQTGNGGSGRASSISEGRATAYRNAHPTVKSRALCAWLVKLTTPPGGVILDPFAGSGSTGAAALPLGYSFIGIELDEVHAEVAVQRCAYWASKAGA